MITLADITPLELANCVGTWVDVPHKPHPVIYMGEFESTGEIKHGAVILDPRYGTNHTRLDNCTPRPDLPRAWNPDGRPVFMETELGHIDNCGDFIPCDNEEYATARRWVGYWEPVEEDA